MTKLNAALPKGEADGLAAPARQLIDQPEDVHVIVALIRNVDPNTGEVLGD